MNKNDIFNMLTPSLLGPILIEQLHFIRGMVKQEEKPFYIIFTYIKAEVCHL